MCPHDEYHAGFHSSHKRNMLPPCLTWGTPEGRNRCTDVHTYAGTSSDNPSEVKKYSAVIMWRLRFLMWRPHCSLQKCLDFR